jgi:hypothetical protein
VAIVQISQITNRLGLNQDLPQLAGGELGWSVDTRQLYIGNGTLTEGAPVVGNTEILTEFSDILEVASAYTYKGTSAGYTVQTGPTAGTPVVQSLQSWLDQFASVKDFGAVGDGVTDDTAAINRALYQLYCRGANTQVRRTLFFPAGTYVVSSTINIPTYASLAGDGIDSSIIQLQATGLAIGVNYVAQTADSLQQVGINIGNTGATPPTDISIRHMGFRTLNTSKNVFLVQSATNCQFNSVGFSSPGTTSTYIGDTPGTFCVNFASDDIDITTNIVFDGCSFSNATYGIYALQQTKGVVVTNSSFNTLYRGVSLAYTLAAVNGGPTGTRITNNIFDNISREGIVFGSGTTGSGAAIGKNVSAYNIFYNVGNEFVGVTNPVSSIILITSDNASIGDMFERSNVYATTYPQIDTGSFTSAVLNNNGLRIGSKTVQSGLFVPLLDAQTGATAFSVDVGPGLNAGEVTSFKIDYSIIQVSPDTSVQRYRTGTCMVAAQGTGVVTFTDDYNENTPMNVYLYASQSGSVVNIDYNTTPPSGIESRLYYSISYLN